MTNSLAEQLEDVRDRPVATFSFKKRVEPIHIELDVDALTWADNMKFAQIQGKLERGEITEEESMEALADLLSKLAGQDIRKLPLVIVGELLTEFRKLASVQDEQAKN